MRSIHRRSWRRISVLSACAGVVCAAVTMAAPIELGQAEGRLQLAQISALLAGRFDNDPQRFYLEGMKRGATAPSRLHLEIRKSTQLLNVFEIEERDGSEHSPIVRAGTLTLENDARTWQVVMRFTGGGSPCEWRWRKHLSAWLGEPGNECAGVTGPPASWEKFFGWWMTHSGSRASALQRPRRVRREWSTSPSSAGQTRTSAS